MGLMKRETHIHGALIPRQPQEASSTASRIASLAWHDFRFQNEDEWRRIFRRQRQLLGLFFSFLIIIKKISYRVCHVHCLLSSLSMRSLVSFDLDFCDKKKSFY